MCRIGYMHCARIECHATRSIIIIIIVLKCIKWFHKYKNSNQDPSSKSSIISNNVLHRNLTPPFTNFKAPEHDNAYRIGYIISAQISNTINEMNQHHHFCSLMHHVVSQIQNNNRIYYQNHRSFSTSLSTVISMHFTPI